VARNRGTAHAVGSWVRMKTKDDLASALSAATDLHDFAKRIAELATALDECVDMHSARFRLKHEMELWAHAACGKPSFLASSLEQMLTQLRSELATARH